MSSGEEKSIWFLVLRAVLVTVVVLSLLTVLKKTGLLTQQFDVPAQVVEEAMGTVEMDAGN